MRQSRSPGFVPNPVNSSRRPWSFSFAASRDLRIAFIRETNLPKPRILGVLRARLGGEKPSNLLHCTIMVALVPRRKRSQREAAAVIPLRGPHHEFCRRPVSLQPEDTSNVCIGPKADIRIRRHAQDALLPAGLTGSIPRISCCLHLCRTRRLQPRGFQRRSSLFLRLLSCLC